MTSSEAVAFIDALREVLGLDPLAAATGRRALIAVHAQRRRMKAQVASASVPTSEPTPSVSITTGHAP